MIKWVMKINSSTHSNSNILLIRSGPDSGTICRFAKSPAVLIRLSTLSVSSRLNGNSPASPTKDPYPILRRVLNDIVQEMGKMG